MNVARTAAKNCRILVIDDHRNIRVSLRHALEPEGMTVDEADCCKAGFARIGSSDAKDSFPYHAVLLDIRMPDGSGLDLLKRLSQDGLASRVIMISGEGTVSEAFQATQMGAFDYIEKPFAPERILVSVRRCLEFNRIQLQNESLTKESLRGKEILGRHPRVQELMTIIERIAPTNGRVLILGESGTGKELVARAVHRLSERAEKPLIKVNCAAIPHTLIESELFGHEKGAFTGAVKARRGLFEQADGGTLFLDEIGELSLDVQAKLLRVLQNGEVVRVGSEQTFTVDVRLLAATNRDLEGMVQDGQFRDDLFYRLNVLSLEVPPLRERGDDVIVLANHFLEEACDEHSLGYRFFGETAIGQMRAYHWPGNIRELKNLVERVAILTETQCIDMIDGLKSQGAAPARRAESTQRESSPSMTTPAVAAPASGDGFSFGTGVLPWHEFHQLVDREYLKFVLSRVKGNVSEAARTLCLERAYLHRLMKKLGVQRDVVIE